MARPALWHGQLVFLNTMEQQLDEKRERAIPRTGPSAGVEPNQK